MPILVVSVGKVIFLFLRLPLITAVKIFHKITAKSGKFMKNKGVTIRPFPYIYKNFYKICNLKFFLSIFVIQYTQGE